MNEISAYPEAAWSYALAFTVFDLDQGAATLVSSSEDPLIAFVAEKYELLRTQGFFRRDASAANSHRWAEELKRSCAPRTRIDGRSALLSIRHPADHSLLSLDGEMLLHLLELAKVVHETSFGSLYLAIAAGYYFQPDGCLDNLFRQLDKEYGSERMYYRVFAFLELGNCFACLKFANLTQARVAMMRIRNVAEGNGDSPRLTIAAAWAYRCLCRMLEQYQQRADAEIPEIVRGLLPAKG